MKEFVDKLISRLEEIYNRNNKLKKEAYEEQEWERFDFFTHRNEGIYIAMAIINKLAEEYNNDWISCSERLPQESEPVGTLCEVVNVMLKNGIVTSGWCNRYLEKWYVLDHYHDYPLPYEYKDVIAWQPLPQPYKPQKNEWKDAVMKHFTNVE